MMDPVFAAHPPCTILSPSEGDVVSVDLGDNRMITVPRSLYTLALFGGSVERDAWETAAPQACGTPFDVPCLR